ncbi:MAG: hypothetical protein E6K86_06360 [Thaumarchaeota archaeon]|nr:MAG: hypothetical protein E6K86_06360 [Nitrososphaerota archaeon]
MEIGARLHRRKNVIYYHVRKRFGLKIAKLTFDGRPNRRLGEFIGLYASDGSFSFDPKSYHYKLSLALSQNQLDYAKIVSRMMINIFGKRPRLWIDKEKHYIILRLYGRDILRFLKKFIYWRGDKTHTIALRAKTLRLGKPFLRGIVRGLVAGDGWVARRGPRIGFGVTSRRLASQYRDMLNLFRIETRWREAKKRGRKTLYVVQVSRKSEVEKFKLRIGMTDPVKNRVLGATQLRR